MGCTVFIGRDIEAVLADGYTLVYRRNNAKSYLESLLYRTQDGNRRCIGVCRTSPACTEQHKPPEEWRSAFAYNGNPKATDDRMRALLGTSPLRFERSGNSLHADFGDGERYEALLDEELSAQQLFPEPPDIGAENIGECLRKWSMGLSEERIELEGNETFIGVIVNTEKHMYIFEMTPSSIYCRAARYLAVNKGIVFHQNFRQGLESYMLGDNSLAHEKLHCDETLFAEDACFWGDWSVYWSVKSVQADCVALNGCNGAEYRWYKPRR